MQSVVVGDDSGVEETGEHKCRAAAEHIPHQDWSTSPDKGSKTSTTVNCSMVFMSLQGLGTAVGRNVG